jgi:hypothetical protein
MALGVDPAAITLNLPEGGSTTISKTVHTPAIPPNPDIVFLVDITTSMGPVIANVQANASSVLSQVLNAQPTAQFAVADYKDQADPAPIFHVRQSLTPDTSAVQAAINNLSLSGGGSDAPEDWINALFEIATGAIDFRSNGTRLVVLIGDSSSHDPSLFHSQGQATSALNDAQIRVIAVDVGPTPDEISDGLNAAFQASAIAAATGGAYLVAPSPDQVSNVILAGLQNLPVTVTPSTGACDASLSVGWSPASATVTSGSDASFAETIAVAAAALPGSTLACSVEFLLNGQLQPGFTETIVDTVPKHPSVLTVSDATSDFHDPGTLSAVLTDGVTSAPIAGAAVSFSMAAESCIGITNAGGSASCSIIPTEAAGSYPIHAAFAGDAQHLPTTGTATYIVTREQTTLVYTGPTIIANAQPVTLSGLLREDGVVPIAGREVVFVLGTGASAQSCSGITDAAGTASCTIASVSQPLGPGTVSATFAGDPFYLPSSAQAATLIFAFLPQGSFVIGDGNAVVGGSVQFWGAQWAKANTLSGGPAPEAFKGFANTVSTKPPACGGSWATAPGNSPPPPQPPLPSHMGVIVSSSATKAGPVISGGIPRIVVVETEPGYGPDPGHSGTGTVEGVFCHS